jgi:hypothetical protein
MIPTLRDLEKLTLDGLCALLSYAKTTTERILIRAAIALKMRESGES